MLRPPDPYRAAVHALLPRNLKDELERADRACRQALGDAGTAKARAHELIRMEPFDRPFETLEAELEAEHERLVQYHLAKLAKKIRWVLEAWKDGDEG